MQPFSLTKESFYKLQTTTWNNWKENLCLACAYSRRCNYYLIQRYFFQSRIFIIFSLEFSFVFFLQVCCQAQEFLATRERASNKKSDSPRQQVSYKFSCYPKQRYYVPGHNSFSAECCCMCWNPCARSDDKNRLPLHCSISFYAVLHGKKTKWTICWTAQDVLG